MVKTVVGMFVRIAENMPATVLHPVRLVILRHGRAVQAVGVQVQRPLIAMVLAEHVAVRVR